MKRRLCVAIVVLSIVAGMAFAGGGQEQKEGDAPLVGLSMHFMQDEEVTYDC